MTVLATDNFNTGTGALSANWTTATGDFAFNVLSNEARAPNDPCGSYYNAVTPGSADYYCQVILRTMVPSGDGYGPMVRCSTSADTKYFFSANTGNTQLYKVVAGTYTQLGSNGAAAATGNTAYLEAVGSNITAKINGSTVIGPISDSAISAVGRGGLFGSDAGATEPTGDDWEMGDFGGAAAPNYSDVGNARNRPGRGPLSTGRFFIAQSMAAYANTPLLQSYSLAAGSGSFALNGQAVATRAARTITAGQGSYALNGQAVAARAGRQLAAAQGTFNLSGQAVRLAAARTLAAAQGAYALNGQAAALRAGRSLLASQGSYALNGQAIGLLAASRLAAAQGTYLLNGQDVTLTYSAADAVLTASSGSFALNGQDAALRAARRLAAAQGAYALNGQAVSFFKGPRLAIEAGAFALNGQAAALKAARALLASPGAYTLNGQTVGLLHSRPPLAAETGSFLLNGQAVLFARTRSLAAASGLYLLNGQNVTLISGASVASYLTADGLEILMDLEADSVLLQPT